jgi:hypothetical protein
MKLFNIFYKIIFKLSNQNLINIINNLDLEDWLF